MKILIAGDFCARDIENTLSAAMFADIKEFTDEYDIRAVNVESALTDRGMPIFKDGPAIRCLPAVARFLADNSFTLALLANNHVGDYGAAGVTETITHLKAAGLDVVGAGKDECAAARPYTAGNVVILNAAEHEFGIANDGPGVNGFDPMRLALQIVRAKAEGKYVVVVLHGGCERNPLPNPGMKRRLRGLADLGADAVINTHTHCPQCRERYGNCEIFYSLGNFVFRSDGTSGMFEYGYMVGLETDNGGAVKAEILPYRFENGRVRRLTETETEHFDRFMADTAAIIADDKLLREYWLSWCAVHGKMRAGMLGDEAFRLNSYRCESHIELMADYFAHPSQNGRRYKDIEKLTRSMEIE